MPQDMIFNEGIALMGKLDNTPQSIDPVSVFISYSHQDDALRAQLNDHLSPLIRQGLITVWADYRLVPGQEWEKEIAQNLESARLILLLISSSFLASSFIYENELSVALKRHESREARVVPVILRPCHWQREEFAKLQALPEHARPVADWPSIDQAFLSVAQGIERVAEDLRRL